MRHRTGPGTIHGRVNFPLGKPVFIMLLIAAVGSLWMARQHDPPRADLVLWTFADLNAASYRKPYSIAGKHFPPLIDQFRQQTGESVEDDLMLARALDVRLISLFMSNARGPRVPDLAEIEIGNIGKFFRPPAKDIGFVPLNGYLTKYGWMDKLVHSRLMTWSKQGKIFLLPHDVHPVTITYRWDLYDQAGVDPAACRTWADFHAACLKFQAYWRARGYPRRMAIELPLRVGDIANIMLLQRGINLVDDEDRVYFTEPRVADTVIAYAQMVAGPGRVAADREDLPAQIVRDLQDGTSCATITADWRLGYIRAYGPQLAGKLKMMPLPKFEPTDAPTGSWGGTGIGIPKNCRDPDLSWRLMEKLYLKHESMEARREYADVIPPVKSEWTDPIYDRPDPYMTGQKSGRMFAELAGQIPVRYQSPYTTAAMTALNEVVYRAGVDVDDGVGDAQLKADVNRWLAEAQETIERRIRFGKFDEDTGH